MRESVTKIFICGFVLRYDAGRRSCNFNRRGVMSMVDKPLEVLNKSLRSPVIVRIRGGREFRGILEGYDMHMNILLSDAEEITGDSFERNERGEILIRGDNVVYISPMIKKTDSDTQRKSGKGEESW
ncbi:MAG: hypothetical protein N2V77_02705 [Canidatus Methanoxibalbensis ujae]|nr:hypothetical protein [Candidatus Methanoxibalbensis ujae]MCW7077778.1 hypothetical protein [Candidatus Methanoxibalbensis ujae]